MTVTSAATTHFAYRADIEGLRGVAVLSVFAVHSVPHAFGGGFIGVDVFFVLSGYLIAAIALQEMSRGDFSIATFYVRRIRRLAPALLLVLATCLAFAAFVAFPSDARLIGKHVAAGAGFVSNLLLWTEGGYFDASAERKLLLHLWSLGIEEQFYLVWPFAAVLLFRRPRHGLAWVVLALVASFALNVAIVADKPKATFFLPPTRFWEMLIGVALACVSFGPDAGPVAACRRWMPASWRLRARLPDAFAWLGVLLLGGALWLIDKNNRFPGWWALLPTTATALLVAAGDGAWVNRVLLHNPVLGFYGRISYPLYLWHWPLLTMPLLLDQALTLAQRIGLLAACVAAATATYFGVERPLRSGPWARHAPWFLGAGLVLVGALGWAVFSSDGFLARYPAEVRAVAAVDARTDYDSYRVDRCFLRSEQGPETFGTDCVDAAPTGRPLMLLWGDSHAAALYPGLRAMAQARPGGLRLAQFTAAACPPGWPQALPGNPHCAEVRRHVAQRIATLRPEVVVLAANWSGRSRISDHPAGWTAQAALQEALRALRSAGVPRVIVIGPLPQWPVSPSRVLLKAWAETKALPSRGDSGLDEEALALDHALQGVAEAGGAEYRSAIKSLCDLRGCLLSLQEGGVGHAVAFDPSHLTAVGSRRLVQLMQPW